MKSIILGKLLRQKQTNQKEKNKKDKSVQNAKNTYLKNITDMCIARNKVNAVLNDACYFISPYSGTSEVMDGKAIN